MTKESLNYEGINVSLKGSKKTEDTLAVEAALQININNEPYTVVMRTPGQDEELIRGLLYAEDIYKGILNNLDCKIIEESENGFSVINVTISTENLGKGYLNKRTLLSVSSCGICGKQKIEDLSFNGQALKNNQLIDLEEIQILFSTLKEKQNLFLKTGGTHSAAVFDQNNQFLTLKEDIGRHNAVDKVVGKLLNQHALKKAHILWVSGRVSYEILSKAFIARIPCVVAVSACSSLAVDYAKELGICLIGFSRKNKATVYANPHYVNELSNIR
ncbi:MAG: formate dehydrogenase accessory sulfurtransferase FdhD [Flavobacteriales bacterium]